MGEAEWLAAGDPIPMLTVLQGAAVREHVGPSGLGSTSGRLATASPRKLRLFAAACALLLPNRTLGLRRSVEAALAFADGDISEYEMDAARWDITPGGWTVCNPDAGEAAYYVVRDESLTDRRAEMAALLRDVFGNPFRPVSLPACDSCQGHGDHLQGWPNPGADGCPDCDGTGVDPTWLTPTVLSVARRAYECHDFAALPVLADALEETGCEECPLLWHLRGQYESAPEGWYPTGPHVRGCWALDLVLGKS